MFMFVYLTVRLRTDLKSICTGGWSATKTGSSSSTFHYSLDKESTLHHITYETHNLQFTIHNILLWMMHFLLASVEVDAEREQLMRQRRLVGKKKSECEADTM